MTGCGGESGQTSRIDISPQAHDSQHISQHGQHTNITKQSSSRHVVSILHQRHCAEKVKDKVGHPLDEGLENVQGGWQQETAHRLTGSRLST